TRTSSVLSRASSRGHASSDAYVAMVRASLEELFGASVKVAAAVDVAPRAQGFEAYQQMVQSLGNLMARSEYTALLEQIEGYRQAPPVAPAGQDARELLWFYEATACVVLKRDACAAKASAAYLETWPQGTYAASVERYREQL